MRTALRLGTACLGVAAILTIATAFTSSSAAAPRTSGECTDANARQLIAAHNLNDFLLPNPVFQLLCGSFAGAGTHARIWRWNGTSLVADAWKQVTPGKPLEAAQVYSPSTNIECALTDSRRLADSEVFCQTRKPPHWVRLGLDGSLKICRGGLRCTSDFGEKPTPQELAYGAQVTVGRFRCLSLRSGMRCVVIRTGKGFLINAAGVARVG